MKPRCDATGKRIFNNQADVKDRIGKFRWLLKKINTDGRHRNKPDQKRVYQCPYCGGYHLTRWPFYNPKEAHESVVAIKQI